MIRSTLALVGLFACVVALAARADPIERPACVAQVAEYLARANIDTPVETLVEKSREFYPDVIELIDGEVASNEYSDAMLDLGAQLGCNTIVEHFRAIPKEVPCYETLDLEKDDMSTLDIVKSNGQAKDAFEAYFACLAATP